MKWLVAAATEVEAAAVPRDHPQLLDVLITGAGKTAAAVCLAAALARLPDPRAVGVLNVGTAGGLVPDGRSLWRPSEAWAWDLDAAGLRTLGIPVQDRVPLDGGDGSVIASGDTFVADAARRDQLRVRASIVDMECFAVALACQAFGTPVRALKWVSDTADESASADWSASVDHGARTLGAAVREVLDTAGR
jgi:adenosylhomocysteine nucleosidase